MPRGCQGAAGSQAQVRVGAAAGDADSLPMSSHSQSWIHWQDPWPPCLDRPPQGQWVASPGECQRKEEVRAPGGRGQRRRLTLSSPSLSLSHCGGERGGVSTESMHGTLHQAGGLHRRAQGTHQSGGSVGGTEEAALPAPQPAPGAQACGGGILGQWSQGPRVQEHAWPEPQRSQGMSEGWARHRPEEPPDRQTQPPRADTGWHQPRSPLPQPARAPSHPRASREGEVLRPLGKVRDQDRLGPEGPPTGRGARGPPACPSRRAHVSAAG